MFPIKNNLISMLGIFVLVAGLGASLFLLHTAFKERTTTRQKIKGQEDRIIEFNDPKYGLPSLELVSSWREKYKLFQEDSHQVIELFNKPACRMPGEIKGPLAFKEQLFNEERKLKDRAVQEGLVLPDSLGFESLRNVIPEEKDVPVLTKQMEVLYRLVDLMLKSGVLKLEQIAFAPPADKDVDGVTGEPVYRKFGITLSLVGQTEKIISLLHQLEIDEFVFVVDELNLEQIQLSSSSGEQTTVTNYLVKADLKISVYVFLFDFDKGVKGEI